MGRRILIAEQADTLRTVAETVLRQAGYDVIAVTAAEKAREVIDLSRPDLIVVGADLTAADGSPYFQKLQQDPQTASLPKLFFERSDKAVLDLPDEVVVPRPFEPKDFLGQVAAFIGKSKPASPSGEAPAAESLVDDDFLDAALGIDQLDVTDSEVMDKTVVGRRRRKKSADEKLVGFESDNDFNDNDTGGTTVESLVIDENSSQIRHQKPGRTSPAPDSTGKLDILPDHDQYGLAEQADLEDDEDSVHDYNWFVESMRDDHKPAGAAEPDDSGELAFTDPSAAVDPVTPGPKTAPPMPKGAAAGVEKFIDEFKKEMEQIRTEDIDKAISESAVDSGPDTSGEMGWEEKLEKMGPAQIDLFAREFARVLGEKVARIIAAKIDPDKLLRLIKSELVERARKSK